MSGPYSDAILFFIPAVLVCSLGLVGFLLGFWRLSNIEPQDVIFTVQPVWRFSLAAIGLLMSAGLVLNIWSHSGGLHDAFWHIGVALLWVMDVVVTAGCLWLAGPLELHFDLERRTYCFRCGWLRPWKQVGPMADLEAVQLVPKTWSGTKEEFTTVYAGHDNGFGVQVRLAWKPPKTTPGLPSFLFRRICQAQAFAQRLSSALDLPLIEVRSYDAVTRK